MEKRLILAFILSFVVLTAWSKFFSPPPSQTPSEYSQDIENKETVEALSFRKSDAAFGSSAVIQEAVEVEEKIQVLENDLVYVEFSNIGGVLKKVLIKAYEAILPVTDIQKLAGYGNLPEQQDKIKLVKACNDLKPIRPIVYARPENGWTDLHKKWGLVQCEDEGY